MVKYIIYTIYSVGILEQLLAFFGQILSDFPGTYERVANEGFSAIQRLLHFLCDFLNRFNGLFNNAFEKVFLQPQ